MKTYNAENATKTRQAVVVGHWVQFFTRKLASKGYRKPTPWLRLLYESRAEAIKAAELYATANKVLANK